MHRNTKIFAGTCAALALTASLAFAAGTSSARSAENGAAASGAADSWGCPGAQYGHLGWRGGQPGYGGCMWGDSGRRD